MQKPQEFLHLIDGHDSRVNRIVAMEVSEEVRRDAFGDTRGPGTGGDDRLHRAGCVPGMPIALKQSGRELSGALAAEMATRESVWGFTLKLQERLLFEQAGPSWPKIRPSLG
jgi:hypothetical protein